MKKIYVFMLAIGLSLALVACGSTSEKENPAPEENNNADTTTGSSTDENNQNSSEPGHDSDIVMQEDMQKQMDDLDYAEFNLEVEYADHTEYEVELDKDDDNGAIEAKIEDSINNVKIRGEEAFNELYPMLKKLTISQQTSKEEAISETLKVFNLDNAYSKFEVEITFQDGTKIEFEDRK